MEVVSSSSVSSSPLRFPYQKLMLSAFYDGVVVFGSVSFVLAVYNLVLVIWWKYRDRRSQQRSSSQSSEGTSVSVSFENSNPNSVCTFKYRKDVETQQDHASGDNECAVCLSAFQDEEQVRQLPRCKHSFHAACIDMWLYSHSDCPLCRATVEKPFPRQRLLRPDENSRERSLDPGSSV